MKIHISRLCNYTVLSPGFPSILVPQLVAQNHSSIQLDTASKGWIGQYVEFSIGFFQVLNWWWAGWVSLWFIWLTFFFEFWIDPWQNIFSEPWLRNDCLSCHYFRPATGINSANDGECQGTCVRFVKIVVHEFCPKQTFLLACVSTFWPIPNLITLLLFSVQILFVPKQTSLLSCVLPFDPLFQF